MSTNFPGSIDTFTNPISSNTLNSPDHAAQHANANDSIAALEAKVGVNSSAVTTTVDYKLSGVPASDKAASKTGTETLTNKTLTTPIINVGSDGAGDLYYRSGGGVFIRLPIGSVGQILDVSAGLLPEWINNPSAGDASYLAKGVVKFLTDAATSGITVASGVANVNAGTGNNQIVKLDASAKLPAVDGSALTNLTQIKLQRFAGTTSAANTTENTVFTTTITGGIISALGMIRVRIPIQLSSTAQAETFTLRLKYGGSTLATIVVTSPAVGGGSAVTSYGVIEGWIVNATTASQNNSFYLSLSSGSSSNSTAVTPYVSTGASDATSAIDTTTNQTLLVTVQRTSNTSPVITFSQTVVETIKN